MVEMRCVDVLAVPPLSICDLQDQRGLTLEFDFRNMGCGVWAEVWAPKSTPVNVTTSMPVRVIPSGNIPDLALKDVAGGIKEFARTLRCRCGDVAGVGVVNIEYRCQRDHLCSPFSKYIEGIVDGCKGNVVTTVFEFCGQLFGR